MPNPFGDTLCGKVTEQDEWLVLARMDKGRGLVGCGLADGPS
jgi:hypothetical protein